MGSSEIQEQIGSLHRFATGLAGNPTDAEDLVQECLRRVLDQLDKGASIKNVKAYLFQTLRNVHIDQCRQSANWSEALPEADDETPESLSAPASQEQRLRCADIASALARLPNSQREIVLLVCLEGMAYEEVAEITQTPIGTVRSRLHRGRAALHEMIDTSALGSHRAAAESSEQAAVRARTAGKERE